MRSCTQTKVLGIGMGGRELYLLTLDIQAGRLLVHGVRPNKDAIDKHATHSHDASMHFMLPPPLPLLFVHTLCSTYTTQSDVWNDEKMTPMGRPSDPPMAEKRWLLWVFHYEGIFILVKSILRKALTGR